MRTLPSVMIEEEPRLYTITLSGLTEQDLLSLVRNKQAGNITLKEMKRQAQLALSMPRPEKTSSTKAVPLITAGPGKVACPSCLDHRGFEPRGLIAHMWRTHGVKVDLAWVQKLMEGLEPEMPAAEVDVVTDAPVIPATTEPGLLECPYCNSLVDVKGRPFTPESLNRHIGHKHPGQPKYYQVRAAAGREG